MSSSLQASNATAAAVVSSPSPAAAPLSPSPSSSSSSLASSSSSSSSAAAAAVPGSLSAFASSSLSSFPASSGSSSASSSSSLSGAALSTSSSSSSSSSSSLSGIIDLCRGDIPTARFGHTSTYMGNSIVILFGGAVGDTGRYTITNDTYTLDLLTLEWSKISAADSPAPRAAHAAACVDSLQFVVYGGATGGGSLSTDELYLLDLRKHNNLAWMSVPITGVTPGRRYGHSMAYHKLSEGHHKANLIVFGGNDGNRALADIWYMDVQKSPFTWNQVQFASTAKQPVPRVYHTAEICKDGPAFGMMVVFGGRTTDSRSLKDTWGLRQHRDGRWDWVDAPVKKGRSPDARFQHSCVFIGSKMLVVGGRDADVSKPLSTAIYDTETCEWKTMNSVCRFRHSSWTLNSVIYTFGGFDHRNQSHPSADLQALNVLDHPGSWFNEKEKAELRNKSPSPAWQHQQQQQQQRFNSSSSGSVNISRFTKQTQQPNSTAPLGFSFGGYSNATAQQKTTSTAQPTSVSASATTATTTAAPPAAASTGSATNKFAPSLLSPAKSSLQAPLKRQTEVRLSSHVHTKIDSPHNPDFSALVRKISIDRLEEEGRKIRGYTPGHHHSVLLQPVCEFEEGLADRVIRRLLKPNITPAKLDKDFNPNGAFAFSWEDVSTLCISTFALVKAEPMVLQVRAPIKVYGDIHGQFYDLMRLFGSYKSPVEEDWNEENDDSISSHATVADSMEITGDIDSTDYLFIGDFVDRGTHSLEVIVLLFALKCKYPKQIHLIRGNHEDKVINAVYGFQDECRRRLREDPLHHESCWEKFNKVFEQLPVGAIIDERILCIHGGIGGSIKFVSDIADLQRPLCVAQVPTNDTEQIVTDLLWSDPTDNDSITGVVPNVTRDSDGSGRIFKFGPDRVAAFLLANKLDLIIRAHECVMDGFERFAGGKLITLFSATDYCGHKNAGALLFVRRDLTIVPKIIYPQDREHVHLQDTWLTMESRPPTPPRSLRRDKDVSLGFDWLSATNNPISSKQ